MELPSYLRYDKRAEEKIPYRDPWTLPYQRPADDAALVAALEEFRQRQDAEISDDLDDAERSKARWQLASELLSPFVTHFDDVLANLVRSNARDKDNAWRQGHEAIFQTLLSVNLKKVRSLRAIVITRLVQTVNCAGDDKYSSVFDNSRFAAAWSLLCESHDEFIRRAAKLDLPNKWYIARLDELKVRHWLPKADDSKKPFCIDDDYARIIALRAHRLATSDEFIEGVKQIASRYIDVEGVTSLLLKAWNKIADDLVIVGRSGNIPRFYRRNEAHAFTESDYFDSYVPRSTHGDLYETLLDVCRDDLDKHIINGLSKGFEQQEIAADLNVSRHVVARRQQKIQARRAQLRE